MKTDFVTRQPEFLETLRLLELGREPEDWDMTTSARPEQGRARSRGNWEGKRAFSLKSTARPILLLKNFLKRSLKNKRRKKSFFCDESSAFQLQSRQKYFLLWTKIRPCRSGRL